MVHPADDSVHNRLRNRRLVVHEVHVAFPSLTTYKYQDERRVETNVEGNPELLERNNRRRIGQQNTRPSLPEGERKA